MVFTVKVFETSGCIKDYSVDVAGAGTSTVAATLEHTAPKKRSGTGCGSQNTSKTHSGMNANKTRKISERKLTGDGDIPSKKQCRSHRILMEDNGDEQDITAEKNTQADTHSDSGIATEAKESDYTSILPVYSKNIGKKFCNANGITSNRLMILKDSGGRSWPVKLTLMSDQVRMKAGWSHFSSHHGIKVGDICVFHLVDENTFNVSMKRAA
ncbi:hypothetical protein ACQ4PT_020219 [Festuca glaucescens]